jgi:hypothetical protein
LTAEFVAAAQPAGIDPGNLAGTPADLVVAYFDGTDDRAHTW